MTPDQFTYWLQGFAELHPEPPTPEQWQSIREHLGTVFNKVTPPFVPYEPLPGTTPYTPVPWDRWITTDHIDLTPKCTADTPLSGRVYC